MKNTISTEATAYTYGLDGLKEYLWDGKLSREEIDDKADKIMDEVIDLLKADGFDWDPTHGILTYDDDEYPTSVSAVEAFLSQKEFFIERVVADLEEAEEALAETLDKAPDTCILRHYKLSDIYVGELILSWYRNVEISEDEVEDLKAKLVGEVNNHLPEHMYWVIETSEIMGKVGQEFDIEDFDALFDKAFDKVLG